MNIIVLNVSMYQFSEAHQETLIEDAIQKDITIATEISSLIYQIKEGLTTAAFSSESNNRLQSFQRAEADINSAVKNIVQLKTSSNVSPLVIQSLHALEKNVQAFYRLGKQFAFSNTSESPETKLTNRADFDNHLLLLDKQIKKVVYDLTNKMVLINDINKVERNPSKTLIVLSSLLIIVGLGIAIYLSRYLNNQLGIDPYYAKGIAKELARGDLSRSIMVESSDKKNLLFALEKMRQQLLGRKIQDQKTLEEIKRIKFALDHVSVGVLITDTYHHIIYTNNELVAIFKNAEAEINQLMPNFAISDLLGKKINELNFLPADEELLNSLTETHKFPVVLGGRHMMIVINPVANEQGEHLGLVSEWHDHTEEVMVENELAAVVAAASMGDFNRIFNVQGKDGVMRLLGEGINQLMHTNKVSLNEISRVLGAITRGDLTEKITNPYFGTFGELKDSTNATVDKLKGIITQIKEVTDVIHNGVKEIASGNNDLSHRTEKQAVSLQETTASMKELTSAVQTNAENAQKANQLAIKATEVATKGGNVIGDVIVTMQGINDSSRKVVDIISVIDGIAFQTNILALNAAVEAARAGDQGRGFAVVAGEVRNLAKLATSAAAEIKSLIGDSVEKIEDGSKLVTQAGKTMNQILDSIRLVSIIMGNITDASAEQSIGIKQINEAITQMDEVTQQNAALVEQAAAASESVEIQAQNLATTVESFNLD